MHATIDSHAHVVPSVFGDELDAVLDRARAAGVERIVCIGSGYGAESAHEAIGVALRHADVHAAIGVHPHDAAGATEVLLDELEAKAQHPRVVAWGEIGLDYHYDHSPREIQRQVFADQLARAARIGRPVVIHTRNADLDTLAVLDAADAWKRGVLIHCFSHTPSFARELLARGAWLSIPGIVTFKKATDLQAAVAEIPIERMLIETDSPFLAPLPHRGKRNEPAHVPLVAAAIAGIKALPLATIARATTENARAFFGLT